MNEEQDDNIMDQFVTINDSLTLFKMQISSIQKMVKSVETDIKKKMNNIKKEKKKDKPKNKRAPSGFAKPTKVTKELCEFMNKPEGTEIARTEVTKTLTKYIKDNNLMGKNEEDKQKIIPDEKLKLLLGITDTDVNVIPVLNYFNMQKYMNKHFYSKKNSNTDNSDNSVAM
jgi:chromatin remodeling complex protein RSC6